MGEELKPCPFCGGISKMDVMENCSPYSKYDNWFWVICKNCGAKSANYELTLEAIEAWNKRT